MRWESVLAWRMERQHLTHRAQALDVVSRICGLHAQVMSSAALTLLARVEDPPDVDALLWERGALVKTWAMRGTLHLLRADELPLYTGAQGAVRPRTESPVWLRHHGLTAARAQALLEAIPAALRDGPLTREALAERAGEPKLLGGFGDLLKPVAFRGRLIFAPSEGQNVRFTLPPPFTPLAADEAIRELTRRYLTAYGPATRENLALWFGSPSPASAGRWLKAVGAVEVDVEGRRAWLLPEDVAAVEAAAPSGVVRLVPAFDQYVVGTPRDETAALGAERRDRVYRAGGWFSPVLLVDGVMAGVWREDDGVVRIEPFAPIGADVRAAAEAEAARLPGNRGLTLIGPG